MALSAMRPMLLGHRLDFDSTVFCRYGEQVGSLNGHNPIKHAPLSHHPVVAWLIEHQRLLWATLRTSHAMTANLVIEFQAQALSMLPSGHRIGLIRTDTYFCVTTFSRPLTQGTGRTLS
ncbi:MAG: hypothetical protein JSS39_06295 [Nitrospira sp.]|nr:hypothetical protein [Nitrospira sp.]